MTWITCLHYISHHAFLQLLYVNFKKSSLGWKVKGDNFLLLLFLKARQYVCLSLNRPASISEMLCSVSEAVFIVPFHTVPSRHSLGSGSHSFRTSASVQLWLPQTHVYGLVSSIQLQGGAARINSFIIGFQKLICSVLFWSVSQLSSYGDHLWKHFPKNLLFWWFSNTFCQLWTCRNTSEKVKESLSYFHPLSST